PFCRVAPTAWRSLPYVAAATDGTPRGVGAGHACRWYRGKSATSLERPARSGTCRTRACALRRPCHWPRLRTCGWSSGACFRSSTFGRSSDHACDPSSNDFSASQRSVGGCGDFEHCLVHGRWRREDVARSEPGLVIALPVGHDAAGRPHDRAARGHVPRAEPQLEESVEHAFGRPAQVETRGTGAAEVLEPPQGRRERALVTFEEIFAPKGKTRG